jgi:hypothetical protein
MEATPKFMNSALRFDFVKGGPTGPLESTGLIEIYAEVGP